MQGDHWGWGNVDSWACQCLEVMDLNPDFFPDVVLESCVTPLDFGPWCGHLMEGFGLNQCPSSLSLKGGNDTVAREESCYCETFRDLLIYVFC